MQLPNNVPATFVHDLANELHSAFKERQITSIQHVRPGKLANILSERFGYANYNVLKAGHNYSEAASVSTEDQEVTVVSIVTQNPDNDSVQSIESEIFYSAEDADNYLKGFAEDLFVGQRSDCMSVLIRMENILKSDAFDEIYDNYDLNSIKDLIDSPEDLIACARKYLPTADFWEVVCPPYFTFSIDNKTMPVKVVTKQVEKTPDYIPSKAQKEFLTIHDVKKLSRERNKSNAVCRGNLIAAIKNDAKEILEKTYKIMVNLSDQGRLEQYVNHESLMELFESLITLHGRHRNIDLLNSASLNLFLDEEIAKAYRSLSGKDGLTVGELSKKVEGLARHNLYQKIIMDVFHDLDMKTPEAFNPTKIFYTEKWTKEDQKGYKKIMDTFIRENLS